MKTMFSVVMPTWNRKDDLAEAIASLMRQKGAAFEIIVIDNGSNDGTREYCLELAGKDERVRYFRFNENKGITVAENKGLSEARGDIVFCMDDDELLHRDDLLQKVEKLAEKKHWDLLNIEVINIHEGDRQPALFSHRKKKHLAEGFYVNNFSNGSVFIKRPVIEKIGLFETHYFRQGQENEYALRAILHGFTILHYPQLSLQHKINPFRPKTEIVSYYMLRNTLLKNYKYFSGTQLFLLQLWQIAQFLIRMLAGKAPPRSIIKALREYNRLKKATSRMLDYAPAAMKRYFFVSRKAVSDPEAIGELSFFQYYVRGLERFLP